MQVTPYSAIISLRKTFITDRNGVTAMPVKVQENREKLEKKHLETVNDLQRALDKIIRLEKTIAGQDESIAALKSDLEMTRKKFKDERNVAYNEHISDIETWNRELFDMNIKQLNIETKFEALTSDKEDSGFAQKTPTTEDSYSSYSSQVPHLDYDYIGDKMESTYRGHKMLDPSSYLNPQIPASIVSHWACHSNKLQVEFSSTSSFKSHYVTLDQPNDEPHVKEKLEHKTIFEKYEQEYQESCKQS